MATMLGERTAERLARGLGWFSLGLGIAQIAAPRGFARMIGADDTPAKRAVVRAVGVREIASGVGALSRPLPARWLWTRVAGDAMDLALLGSLLDRRNRRRRRAEAAIAAVAGVTVPDLVGSMRLSQARALRDEGRMHARAAITVKRPVEEVYGFWRNLENFPRFMAHVESVRLLDERRSHWAVSAPGGGTAEWDAELVEDRPNELIAWRAVEGADVPNRGSVRFTRAPGGRGTEIRLQIEYSTPAGALGAAVAKLLGEEPEQQVKDDLRRLKQVLETGDIVRSEGSPEGTDARRLMRQRPAQPLERATTQ